ncbi:uncharacterized protein Z518_09752 [Rhinocladiella mackenziei CBS 650.93]|uniref:AAA-ATPase-like domain-containing protein n=1 Tax=Rhinocladiella mackenziei CBS 650.93 TaxID=1442369 RepID=A0A0D2FF95_9EURO|nr:uncharacterized protein Z518_09752 [Rhinocladiella mackenziei CBS 650.93]KIX00687.1 hypothetical protein Z518_09752 [Rhinocladiella mackenziei CBS 650.93]
MLKASSQATRRRCVVPTSPVLPLASLFHCHSRIPRRYARIPLLISRLSSTSLSNSKLALSGELTSFPLGRSDFGEIRQLPGTAYFDKTEYIPVLAGGPAVQLVCRPRRFGKSLTISMLRYFHGFQFRGKYHELFQVCGGILRAIFAHISNTKEDLDVDKAVQNRTVAPGKYFILTFNFSRAARSGPSVGPLTREMNRGLSQFKLDYAALLGNPFTSEISHFDKNDPAGNLTDLVDAVARTLGGIHDKGDKGRALWDVQGIYLVADEYDAYSNEYMDPHDPKTWSETESFYLLKAFWSNVKAARSLYGIRKTYITGVTPLLLSGLTSGANDLENTSFIPELSTICGLTRSDVLNALRVICHNKEDIQRHFRELER